MAADPVSISHIVLTTNLAAAAGAIAATALAWAMLGKPDIGMTINGALGGLVGITAGRAFVSLTSSLIIGAIAGALIVLGVLLSTSSSSTTRSARSPCTGWAASSVRWPSGCSPKTSSRPAPRATACSTAAASASSPTSSIGVAAVGGFVFAVSLVVWLAIRATLGVRVTAEEEIEGLDIGEHGNRAYPDFVLTDTTF